jgi:RNA polymerase sigma-70 factor (ECF subfamily)
LATRRSKTGASGQRTELTDKQLVARANKGDESALETLYERQRDWATAVAYGFLGNREDALDVLQDTFIYFFGKFPGFELTSSLRSFLYPAIKHRCISLIRRRRKVVDIDAYRKKSESESVEFRPLAGDFERLVAPLPPGQREVVTLRFAFDFRLAEIADALEIPVGTVKSRLHNALKSLHSGLDAELARQERKRG